MFAEMEILRQKLLNSKINFLCFKADNKVFLTLTRLLFVFSVERQRDRQVHHHSLVRRQQNRSRDVQRRQQLAASERQVKHFDGVVFAGDFELREQNASVGSVDENICDLDARVSRVNDLVAGEGKFEFQLQGCGIMQKSVFVTNYGS